MDRPGIVSDVTKFVTDAGGNVGQSQAAKLGDYFSIMMQIEVPEDEKKGLEQSLAGMQDLNATMFPVKGGSASTDATKQRIACTSLLYYFLLLLKSVWCVCQLILTTILSFFLSIL